MDLKNYVDSYVKERRNETFENSSQLTLGEIIKELEKCGTIYKGKDKKTIEFDFGSAIPTTLDSWRGSYSELALGYELSGYDGDADYENITVEKLLENLKSAIGKEFTGWKGGEFIMDEDTPVWVSNPGNADNTGIIGVLDLGYSVVLLTAYCDY